MPGTLWLAGLMGLLAVCAFSFLGVMVVRRARRSRDDDTVPLPVLADADCAAPAADGDDAARSFEPLPEIDSENVDDGSVDPMILSDDGAAVDADDDTETDDDTDTDDEELDAIAYGVPNWDADEAENEAEDADNTWQVACAEAADADGSALTAEEYNDLLAALATPDEADDDWFAVGGETTEFDEFDPGEDDLVVVWDDTTNSEPTLQIVRSEDDPDVTHVLMGDVIVARFRTKTKVDYDQVAMIPLSTARQYGWARA